MNSCHPISYPERLGPINPLLHNAFGPSVPFRWVVAKKGTWLLLLLLLLVLPHRVFFLATFVPKARGSRPSRHLSSPKVLCGLIIGEIRTEQSCSPVSAYLLRAGFFTLRSCIDVDWRKVVSACPCCCDSLLEFHGRGLRFPGTGLVAVTPPLTCGR